MDLMMIQGIWLGMGSSVIIPPSPVVATTILYHPYHPSHPTHPTYNRNFWMILLIYILQWFPK